MSGPFKRRASLKALPTLGIPTASGRRRSSLRPILAPLPTQEREVRWDLLDRCLLPVIFCNAAAVVISYSLHFMQWSEVAVFPLFVLLTAIATGLILFYHNLKVSASGKAVLITGCDSRIGSALARYLDEQGFTVFAGFQDSEHPLAEELKEECSARMHVLQLDVTCETDILAASLYACEHLPDYTTPGLWAVIHCAQWIALGEIEWVPHQVIQKATEINLLGPMRVNQVMLPLVRRARGRIVFLTSGMCRIATPVRGIHCAMLAAIESQAMCLREELRARGVDVVVVAPGEFSSGNTWLTDDSIRDQARDMWKQLHKEQRNSYGEDYFESAVRSLEKFSKPQDADITPVLRALTEAIICTFPLPMYTPVTRKEKLQILICDHFPRSVYEFFYS